MIVEFISLAVSLALIYHFFVEFRGQNLPPGPRPWPIIGNLNFLTKDLHLTLTKLEEKYGKIYRLYVGHRPMIVISGDLIKEALVRKPKEFAGRPRLASKAKNNKDEQITGLPMLDYGPRWKLYRKLSHSAIKVYSEGHLQELINKEVEELCKRIELQDGKLDISMEFSKAVTNIIYTKIAGERFEVDDPEFLNIFNINNEITKAPFGQALKSVFPFLEKILPGSEKRKKFHQCVRERNNILMRKYQQHKERFDGETIRDYTDALLYAKQEAEKEDHTNQEHLQDEIIVNAGITSLFTAGSETTSTTLTWAVAYLLHHPDIQERLYDEITCVFDKEEFPSLKLKKSLPILEAFITETLRFANLAPLGVPHKTTVDVVLEGFNIPKDTTVFANTWSLHHDPTIWKDPFKFSVDRHLDEGGNFVPPIGGTFLPFGAGPRVCVGEVLARSELFVFLCRLLQQFKFENPPGCELPSLVAVSSIILHPKPYLVRVIKRN